MAPYTYQPLNESARETRIMVLHPGLLTDELCVSLETVVLANSEDSEESEESEDSEQSEDSEESAGSEELEGGANNSEHVNDGDSADGANVDDGLDYSDPDPDHTGNSASECPVEDQDDSGNDHDDTEDESPRPRFEALSYAWGSRDYPSVLKIVDECGEAGTIAITKNLAEALPYLRLADKERRLWIDAVCVNQQDIVERSSQVKLMASIFGQAELVIAWIGLESSDSRVAFDYLVWVGTKVAVDWVFEFRYVKEDRQDLVIELRRLFSSLKTHLGHPEGVAFAITMIRPE
ncbi:hypothetical protein LTR65_003128 [Meristemomyces frigidus]